MPQAALVAGPFHMIQDANRHLGEARRVEQVAVCIGRRIRIPDAALDALAVAAQEPPAGNHGQAAEPVTPRRADTSGNGRRAAGKR